MDETWLGSAVHLDLDCQTVSFRRQVGLAIDQVRLAAMAVDIPVSS